LVEVSGSGAKWGSENGASGMGKRKEARGLGVCAGRWAGVAAVGVRGNTKRERVGCGINFPGTPTLAAIPPPPPASREGA